MPSGGGSFGGGGGGGGGFSGGGFGGGGFSSYSSHHYYGSRSYRSGRHSGGRRSSPLENCIWITVTLIVVIIIVMIILMVRYTQNSRQTSDSYYSPGDSRLEELNTLFCSKVSLSESSTFTDANMYLLEKNEIPPITDRNNFSIVTDFSVGANEYQFWQYRLYPKSNVSITACIQAGSSITLSVIKGTENFNNWVGSGSSSHTEQSVFINQLCSNDQSHGTQVFVTEEDEWYFTFSNTGTGLDQVSATLSFERFQYNPETLTNISQTCSTTNNGECSLNVDFISDRKYLLIITSIPSLGNVDWGENVDVTWECGRKHLGYFLVIGVPILGILFLIIVGVGMVLLVWCVYMNKDKFESFHIGIPTRSSTTPTTHELPSVVTTAITREEDVTKEDDIPEEVLKQSETRTEAPPPYPVVNDSYSIRPPPPYAAF